MKALTAPSPAGLLACALLTMAALGILSAHAADPKAAPPRPALTVTTVLPSQASLPVRLAANGNISAWQEAIVGSEVNGLRLTEVRVNVGDAVRRGQVLAVFSDDTVRADVAQARAALMEAEANAQEAAGNAARARTLQATGALSTQQINQYLTLEQTAKARVAAARATLDVQQTRLRQTRLTAPDTGVISSRGATVGAVVGAGAELFRLIRQGRLEWRAEVTAAELARIRTGAAVTVTAANGARLAGRVRMVAPTVDPQTRAALVYVDLPQAMAGSAPAKAGMFARGEFELGSSSALTVPQQAVVVRDGFDYVFRLNPDGRVTQLKVQTGRRLGDRIEVVGGLAANAEVVVAGAGFLNDGDLVRKVGAQPAPVPNAAPARK